MADLRSCSGCVQGVQAGQQQVEADTERGGVGFTDPATATARIVREFDGWAPELLALIIEG